MATVYVSYGGYATNASNSLTYPVNASSAFVDYGTIAGSNINYWPNQTAGSQWLQPIQFWPYDQVTEWQQMQSQAVTIYLNGQFAEPETEEKKAKRAAAEQRAEELLMLVLSDEQRQQYLEHGYFETAVDDRVYRVRKGYSGNVFQLKDGKECFRYCIHPSQYVPDADTMVAQLLMLRNDEQQFLRVANRTELL